MCKMQSTNLVYEATISRACTYRTEGIARALAHIANPNRDLYLKTKNLLPFRATDFVVL